MVVSVTPVRPSHVPQAERRARTRKKLLDAAIEALAELGYAATTTVEVAHRAGVSRGAQQHHFRSKAELLAAAIEHAFDQRIAQFAAAVDAQRPGGDVIDGAVDLLWSMFDGPVCEAWVELLVAARTDEELRGQLGVVGERMRAAAEDQFHAMVPNTGDDAIFYPVAVKFAFALFDGVVLHRMAGYDAAPGRTETTVEAMKLLAHLALTGTATGAGRPRRRRRSGEGSE